MPTPVVASGAGFTAATFNHGSKRLRAHLYWPNGELAAVIRPDGRAMASVDPDGTIYAKVGWWRGVARTTRRHWTTARRTCAEAPRPHQRRLRVAGFQPSGLTFPTVGCWRVVGKVGEAQLSFVVKVTKLRTR